MSPIRVFLADDHAVLVYTLAGRYLPLFEGKVDVERAQRIGQGTPTPQAAGD
jgi:hypothetical protein